MMRFFLLLIALSNSLQVLSQKNDYKSDKAFFQYLVKNSQYKDVASFISLNEIKDDSTLFYVGKYYFYISNYNDAISCFRKFDKSSSFYERSIVNKNNSLVFAGLAPNFSDTVFCSNDTSSALLHFSFKSYYALKRDIDAFEKYYSPLNIIVLEEDRKIKSTMDEWKNHKNKSPVIAGLLSAIIPGSGKVYAKKPWQGLSSFLLVTAFGLSAWEGYKKNSFNSPQFYLFGSLCATFYIGNIWGSVSEVKLQKKHFNQRINDEIYKNLNHCTERNNY